MSTIDASVTVIWRRIFLNKKEHGDKDVEHHEDGGVLDKYGRERLGAFSHVKCGDGGEAEKGHEDYGHEEKKSLNALYYHCIAGLKD